MELMEGVETVSGGETNELNEDVKIENREGLVSAVFADMLEKELKISKEINGNEIINLFKKNEISLEDLFDISDSDFQFC